MDQDFYTTLRLTARSAVREFINWRSLQDSDRQDKVSKKVDNRIRFY